MHRRVFLASSLGLLATGASAQSSARRVFDFRRSLPGAPGQWVDRRQTYTPDLGYGYEPVATPGPDLFSVAVPEGNYRVTVHLGGGAASDTTIKAESRRLMLESVKTRAKQVVTHSFVVNVRNTALKPPPNNAPGFDSVYTDKWEVGSYTWDDRLTLEFAGPAPAVARLEIEPVTVPTVFLAGDSTVTDQRWENYASWGQMLPRFLKPTVAVANHAESGQTLKSFLVDRRLQKVLSLAQPGDYLFIQFGHNDMQKSWPHTYVEAATTYRDYLKAYVAEARLRQLTPVLVTPITRRLFDAEGRIRQTLGDYPDAVRAVAKETGTTLIDLNLMGAQVLNAWGKDRSLKAFGYEGKDPTHTDNLGAYAFARCVIESIRTQLPELAVHIADDLASFTPEKPGLETFTMAPSRVKPEGAA